LVGSEGQHLKFNTPDIIQRELMLVDQQFAGQLLAEDDAPLSNQQKEKFIIGSLREEAIASSMLEGAATTRRDAKRLLQSGRNPKTRGERMVVNNYHAIMFVRENRESPLSRDFLLELQSILTKNTLDDGAEVGRFRQVEDNVQVIDGRDNEVIHVPPPAQELDERIKNLCDFANDRAPDIGFVHPMIRACILHFQLGFDHPFCDGNGRTARALFYWSMLQQNYWLFEYLPISRLIYNSPAQYVRAYLYSEVDDFDVTYFLAYKTRIIARARRDLREYLKRKQRQVFVARKLFAEDRRLNHRQREAVLLGARNPDRVFTIAEHKERFAISYATARGDLLRLAEWGYFTFSPESKRYDFYPSQKLIGVEQDR
jgi:Fic family protein